MPVNRQKRLEMLTSAYGLKFADVQVAIDALGLKRREDLMLFLAHLDEFTRKYGLDAKALAKFVARNTTGAKPQRRRRWPVTEAWRSLVRGDLAKAQVQANKMLQTAESRRGSWDEGNLVHHAHLILGHIRLREGDVAGAERHLLEAGRTPGSPQLDTFGPNMTLAKALLERGRRKAVLEYFRECASFWQMHDDRLVGWTREVRARKIPDFGPNLLYGGSRGLEQNAHSPHKPVRKASTRSRPVPGRPSAARS